MILRHATGRIPSIPDPRNEDFRIKSVRMELRHRRSRTLRLLWRGDQGLSPFCVGFAGEAWQRTTPSLHGTATLDATGYYNGAQAYDEWPGVGYDGTSVHGLMKFLVAHPDNDVQSYRWARTTDEIALWLNSEHASPVVLGINWLASMWEPDANATLAVDGPVDGGHSLIVIGYAYGPGKSIGFLLQNSWGRGWGLDGRAWIAEKDLQRLLDEDGEAAVASKLPR